MAPARRRRPAVLVYHPDEVEAYARLINIPRGRDVEIHVAATEAEAAVHIAQVEGPTLDAIGRLVTDEIGSIDGVTRTTTCVAVSLS